MPLNFALDFENFVLQIFSITGVTWDISLIMDELNIHEDLFNATCSAELVIDDANNYINNIPITGHERIQMSFKTPGKGLVNYVMRIMKISHRTLEKERRQVYILHCISEQEYTNAKTRVSKAYKAKLISEIALDVQRNYLDSEFIELETTKFKYHIIPAYWTPIYTMNFLCGRAQSTSYKGANYVYYENNDGFHFVSLEKLCDQGPKIKYIYQPANVRRDGENLEPRPRTVDTDEVAVQSYQIFNNFDTLANINNGMYSSRLLWHDIQKKEFDFKDFDYPGEFASYKHVDTNKLWTSQSDFNSDKWGAYRHYPLGQEGGQETWCREWMLPRIFQMQEKQNVIIHATVPGDSDRRVGDIVTFQLPSPEPLDSGNQLILDKYYQGKYLITSLKHRVIKSQYTTILEMVKDAVFTPYG